MTRPARPSVVAARVLTAILVVLTVIGTATPVVPVQAAANLSVTPLTWNIVGLDSNNVTVGPNHFPVGARVCNIGDAVATNIQSAFNWATGSDPYINLRPGSNVAYTASGLNLNPSQCTDFYYEVEITRDSAAYNHTRGYTITASADGGLTGSTPQPRELYVEHLISQSRNSVNDVKLNGVSVPAGGTMVLAVGNTYTIELDGATATNGYNQLESFISLPNTIFQVLSVSTSYSVSSLGSPISKLYADACGWDPDPLSATYRSCIGSDGKAGGTVDTTYQVKIISGGGTTQTLTTLLYDFSGSSFHYNSDLSTSARIASIIDPNQVTIAKAFSPSSTVAGGSSTLTIALSNPTAATISGVSFSDDLPTSPGSMLVATPPNAATSGCGSPTFSPIAAGSSISFTNGTIAPNSTCSISVRVVVPASPVSGTYTNTTNDVFVGTFDTLHTATAVLTVTPAGTVAGICGVTLAQWTYPNSDVSLAPSSQASDVLTATGSAGQGLTGQLITTVGNPVGSLQMFGWAKTGVIVTSTSPFYQYAVDTSHYTQVMLRFDASIKSNGPGNVFLYSSTDGTTFTQRAAFTPTTSFATFGPYDFTGLTATGTTYFRFYGLGANATTSGNDFYLDNVAFSGCGTPQPLTIAKAFQPNPIALNGTSQLTFVLTNTNSVTVTSVQFTDALPSGLQVAAAPGVSTLGCGMPAFNPAGGDTTLNFTGGSMSANSTCTVKVNVTGTSSGPHLNVSGFISSTETGLNSGAGGSASASLSVLEPPVISKLFAPNPILANGTTTLTFTIVNPNPNDSLPSVAFTDTLPVTPGAMHIAAAPNASTSGCGSPTFTAVAGAGALSFSNGTIAAGGSCVVSVDVTAAATGDYTNTSGLVSSTIAGVTITGNSASDTLHVTSPHPSIALAKQIATSAGGPWTDFVVVAPGSSVYYRLTVENTGDVPLSSVTVSDPNLSLASCTFTSTLPVASPTQDPTSSCALGPITALLGDVQNTATAHGSYLGTVYTATSSAQYVGANPGLDLVKQIGQSASGPWSSALTGVRPDTNLFYKFIAINNGGLTLTSLSLVDPLIDTSSCVLIDPLAPSQSTDCATGPVSASSTIGIFTNTAVISGTHAGTTLSATASASYSVIMPDLVVTKTDSTAGSIAVGSGFTWTVTVGNDGTDVATFLDGQTILSDNLPAGAVYSNVKVGGFANITNAADIACGIAAASLSCAASGGSVGIGAGGSFNVAYAAVPTATGSLDNLAVVDPSGVITESNEENNTSGDIVSVNGGAPDLALAKSDGGITAAPGGLITYTLTYTNTGIQDAAGATLTETVPGNTTYHQAGSTASWSCSDGATAGTACTLAVGSVAASGGGGSAIFIVAVASPLPAGVTQITNTATIDNGGVNDATPADNTSTVVTPLNVGTPKIDLRGSPPAATIGQTVLFTIVITLPEGLTNNLVVSDSLPAGLAYISHQVITSAAASGGAFGTNFNGSLTTTPVFTNTGGLLQFGFGDATATNDGNINDNVFIIQVVAQVQNILSNQIGTVLTDTASLSFAQSGGTATLAAPRPAVVTVAEPVLQIHKSVPAAPHTFYPGDVVTYTIVVSHRGDSQQTAYDTVITDVLPANLTNVSASASRSDGLSLSTEVGGGLVRVPSTVDGTFVLPLGMTTTVLVTGTVDITAHPNDIVTNTAFAIWRSLPAIPGGGERHSGDGLLDGGGLNDYEVGAGVAFRVGSATVINLVSFTGTLRPDGTVELDWQTGAEINTAGFNVYRAASATGSYLRLNPALIAAQGSQGGGASYTFTDNPGAGTWYYELEDVDTNNVSTRHGPIVVNISGTTSQPNRIYLPIVNR